MASDNSAVPLSAPDRESQDDTLDQLRHHLILMEPSRWATLPASQRSRALRRLEDIFVKLRYPRHLIGQLMGDSGLRERMLQDLASIPDPAPELPLSPPSTPQSLEPADWQKALTVALVADAEADFRQLLAEAEERLGLVAVQALLAALAPVVAAGDYLESINWIPRITAPVLQTYLIEFCVHFRWQILPSLLDIYIQRVGDVTAVAGQCLQLCLIRGCTRRSQFPERANLLRQGKTLEILLKYADQKAIDAAFTLMPKHHYFLLGVLLPRASQPAILNYVKAAVGLPPPELESVAKLLVSQLTPASRKQFRKWLAGAALGLDTRRLLRDVAAAERR